MIKWLVVVGMIVVTIIEAVEKGMDAAVLYTLLTIVFCLLALHDARMDRIEKKR